jgi:2-dehydropantoate 2-reductase
MTGKNKNSMLQDVLSSRPTEVDYLNGYVARYAESVQKRAPVNGLLYRLVKAKESLYN